MLGNYEGSTHLQGELIGTLLDIFIRNKTNNKYSIDDVMRKMNERFSGAKGFTAKDVEQAISEVCGCSVQAFFQEYIRGSKSLPFNQYLQLIGLQTRIIWKDAADENGKASPDLRVYAWQDPNSSKIFIGIEEPTSVWTKAGLHTGDQIISVNEHPMTNNRDFYNTIRKAKIGDVINIEVKRNNKLIKASVKISGFQQAVVTINEIKKINNGEKQLQQIWLSAK
jgi:predicted metalloprotease with PDZ domain